MPRCDVMISVLIPAYNHASYIEKTVRSVFGQEFSDCEIVVLDDGSTDQTYSVAKSLCECAPVSMRVYSRENKGLNKTLNELTRLSSGRYLYFLASDDMLAPGALDVIARELAIRPSLKIFYGNGSYVYHDQEPVGKLYSGDLLRIMNGKASDILTYLYTKISNILTQSSVISREFLAEIGGFDESALLDDWPHQIKIFKKLASDDEWKFLDVCMFYYRRHETNMSRDVTKQFLQITDTVNRFIPKKYAKKLLARSYFNLGMVALLNCRFQGIKLLLLSQKMEPSVGRLFLVPIVIVKAIHEKITRPSVK